MKIKKLCDTNYLIPTFNLGELNLRIEKLNKRAVKLGLPAITLQVVATHERPQTLEGSPRVRRYFEISVDGVAPRLPGWTFLGTLEHTDHGNILRSVPGQEIPESYRLAARTCDHCQKIRNRKDTYVVRHQDGTLKQLGHQCIADYLGHVDPHHLARMAAFVRTLEEAERDEEGFCSIRAPMVEELEYFLAMTSTVIRNEGWMSATAARNGGVGCPTSMTVWNHVFPTTHFMQMLRKDGRALYQPCEADFLEARAAIQHIAQLEPTDQYTGNLKILALGPLVEYRQAGLAASMIPFYQRAMAREVLRKQQARRESASEYFGTVGQREIFELTVMAENTFEGHFGTTSLYRLQDASGNCAVWFTASGSLEVGKTYRLKATVKAHQLYKETTKQTVLSRCKIEEEQAA